MRFLHLHVHRRRYRDAVIARATFEVEFREPPAVDCPRCGWTYFADIEEDLSPLEAEEWVYLAARRLTRECPDHPHRFDVGM